MARVVTLVTNNKLYTSSFSVLEVNWNDDHRMHDKCTYLPTLVVSISWKIFWKTIWLLIVSIK